MTPAGPELPPQLSAKRKHEERNADEESSKSTPPPALGSPNLGDKRRRVMGPSLPPAPLDEMPEASASGREDVDTSSSDDDDIGPALPPAPHEMAASQAQAHHSPPTSAPPAEKAKPQREEWMTLPPTSGDWTSRMDPTKLRSRKFQTGKSAAAPKGTGIGAVWTETPEQKRQRLADEVMGVKRPAALDDGGSGSGGQAKSGESAETARRIREYNEARRGRSLLDEHKGREKREEEDDPSARAFDREKDIAGAPKISHAKKREMLSRAGDLGSRFAAGNYL
ncbi:MAG: hypothetical protein M1829_001087 [Trizodia sp. TS-e1964]|nr:MAG: hypothetical protein M1829_001087 [Trizodia sp. TS-e1964]